MTEQEVKDFLGIASSKIKDKMIPAMTNVLMDIFQYGLNAGTELGVKIANDKHDSKTQSCIEWQTGEPKEEGEYLVQLKYGHIRIINWEKFNDYYNWTFFSREIIAWCKLSDIKPYKEETK